MKTRVVKNKNGKYIVQFKREIFGISMFWWTTSGYLECSGGGNCWNEPYIFKTENEAVEFMIKMVLERETKDKLAEEAGVVAEATSEEVREKFPQFLYRNMIRVKKDKNNLYIIERRVGFHAIKMWWRAVSYYRGLPYVFASEEEAVKYFVKNLATEYDKQILSKIYPEYII